MRDKVAVIIHQYNPTCKNEVATGTICSACEFIAKQVCFTISLEFKAMFLGK